MKRKLQVFVSSTFSDLIEERQAAVSAILKAGHIPAGMELFTAGDQSQMRVIEQWIDDSDVYMLILGGRYGSIESNSGLSYTELEFQYAVQQGKPLFSVVIREDALESKLKAFGSGVIEKDNPQQLVAFRSKVLSNISSFFSDEKDIRLAVYESLSDFATNRDLKGWVSGSDVPDVEGLRKRLTRLEEENAQLKKAGSSLRQTASALGGTDPDEAEDISSVLKAIDVKIPDDISKGKEITRTLLDLFMICRDELVKGVTNQYDMQPVEKFIYFNIAPKLQIYGLVDNEKVPGVAYRRSFMTQKGMALAAKLERQELRKRGSQGQTEDGQEKDASSPPKVAETPSPIKRPRKTRKPKPD